MTATDDAPRVIVHRIPPGSIRDPYPWRFDVEYRGVRHLFRGVPNYCATRRSAAIRGWWRARWMRDGTYADHYVAPGDPPAAGKDGR